MNVRASDNTTFGRNEEIVFCVIGLILLLLLVTICVSFLAERNKQRDFKQIIVNESASVRLFYINKPNNQVRFFNLSSMNKVKVTSLDSFYASFPLNEQNRLKEWIDALLEGKQAPIYYETLVYFHKERRTVPSFLQVDSLDVSKGILHLKSYLLRFNKPTHSSNRSFSTETDFAEYLRTYGNKAGVTYCFSLAKANNGFSNFDPRIKDAELTAELANKFKNLIVPYASKSEKVIRLSAMEIVVANFDIVDISNAIYFALRVKEGVEKALNGGSKKAYAKYRLYVGIVNNKDINEGSDALLDAARISSYEALKKQKETIHFYSKDDSDISLADELHYRNEVDRIIYEKKLSFSYRPIYAVSKKKIYGYLARAIPTGTSFGSLDELKNYAIRAKDEKSLFASMAKKVIPTFVNERMDKTHKLFYPVRMDERTLISSFFSHYPSAKEANLVFVFKENDIAVNYDSEEPESLAKFVSGIKKSGYKFAIYLSGKNLALDKSVYSLADAFLVDFSSGEDANMDTAIRSELHALVEKLMRFKKPIIGTNLMNWNAIELVVGSKVEYISSDSFAPYETMFKPLNTKNVDRLKEMVEP